MSDKGIFSNQSKIGPFTNSSSNGPYGKLNSKKQKISYNKFSNLIDRIFSGLVTNADFFSQSFASHIMLEKKKKGKKYNDTLISISNLIAVALKKSPHPAIKALGIAVAVTATELKKKNISKVTYDLYSPHSDISYFIKETKEALSELKQEIKDSFDSKFRRAKHDKNLARELESLYSQLEYIFFFKGSRTKNNAFDTTNNIGINNALDEYLILLMYEWFSKIRINKYRPFILFEKHSLQHKEFLPRLILANFPPVIKQFIEQELSNLQVLLLANYFKAGKYFEFQNSYKEIIPVYYSWGGKNSVRWMRGEPFPNQIIPDDKQIIFKLTHNYLEGNDREWKITSLKGMHQIGNYLSMDLSKVQLEHYGDISPIDEWNNYIFRHGLETYTPNKPASKKPRISTFHYHTLFKLKDFRVEGRKMDISTIDDYFDI